MPARSRFVNRTTGPAVLGLLVVMAVAMLQPAANAQSFTNERAVGGISIDTDGVLNNATVDDLGMLSRFWKQHMGEVPAELAGTTPLRKVSLRGLEAAIQEHTAAGRALPDDIRYLAGLQQIRYVFVYPEQGDIVLVGPGEGWKVDAKGNVVGATNGRPAMHLEDLLVALRTAQQAARGGISCSIDPTAEGMARFQKSATAIRRMAPAQAASALQQALGPQQITVQGIPATSHFARVLVAADYRMKRLAMKFDAPPIRGLPAYLDMISASGSKDAFPRWWLEPNYEPIVVSPDGLAWELRGASVKAMTAQDFFAAGGQRQKTVKASPMAQRWADNMTEHYDELAVAEPIFGELRNCMELAIVSALIAKERLTERAGYSMPVLMDGNQVAVTAMPAPRHVDSKVSMVRKRGGWVISASGGVMVNSWRIADRTTQDAAPAAVRAKAAATEHTEWWWN